MPRCVTGWKHGLHTLMAVVSAGWITSGLYAQVAPAEAPPKLKVSVLVGEGAVHNIHQPKPAEVILEVADEAGRPLSGVIVVFQLPSGGAGGKFPTESLFSTVTTDASGRAVVKGLQPNATRGKWSINVTASYQGLTVSVAIAQVNEDPGARPAVVARRGGSGKIIAVVAAVGAAAAGGLVAASRGKSGGGGGGSTPTPPTVPPATTITIGTITVGRP